MQFQPWRILHNGPALLQARWLEQRDCKQHRTLERFP
jgi:hypothetical protein